MSGVDAANWQKQRTNAHAWKRQTEGWYPEPPSATIALAAVEPLDGHCWDPACGGGTIPDTLTRLGKRCIGSDMVDRAGGRFPRLEFLSTVRELCDPAPDNIVTNPPFQLAQRFIDHGLKLAGRKVIVLARLAFLESESRAPWFATVPLARVWVFPWRLSMPPGGVATEAKGGKVAFAWFVFDRAHPAGDMPRLGWLRKPA